MHNADLLTIFQIYLLKAIKSYHARHYMWEIAKVLVPVILTGLITFIVMRVNDTKNKRRWLNDGHLKRKVELEIQIRKFLLGIKCNASEEYETLADLYNSKNNIELEDINSRLIYNFNKDFEALSKYLKKEEDERNSNLYEDESIFAAMDEYVCYVPKMQNLFDEFKALSEEISNLKTICENETSEELNIPYNEIIKLIQKRPKHFEKMVNTYLCFELAVDRILKKLSIKKIK